MFIATYGKVTLGTVVGIIALAILQTSASAAILIQIDNPTNNSSFIQGEFIMFSGNASGGIAPYNYSWTSSIDGFIGKASTIYNSPFEENRTRIINYSLSPGTHRITMVVNDSSSLTNSTSTNITVNPASTTNISGQSATGVMKWNVSNFPAFWQENDKSSETLQVLSVSYRDITDRGLWYNTTKRLIPYKVYSATGNTVVNGEGGGGYYAKVGWFGRGYVALRGKANKMAKLILEQSETENKTLLVGETWDMGDGYTLKLNSIDTAFPRQANVILNKSGKQLDDKVKENFTVYTYVSPSFSQESDVPIFVTYFDNISTNSVRLKYTWLISDNVLELHAGDKIGNLEVMTSSDREINMTNKDKTFTFYPGSTINIADGLRLKVNDTPDLQYYPEMTVITVPPSGTSVESSTGKGTVIVNTDAGTVENLTAVNVSDIPEPPPAGANLYYGLFRFNITGLAPGGSTNIILTFPDNLPVGTTYWKYGANATNTTPHWYTIPSTINGNELRIMLTDGGNGDDDLVANGRIRDDSGPSIPQALLPVHNLNTGENFSIIQAAIDDADTLNGHTIIVDSGTYYENVNVNKQLILRGIDNGGGMPVVDAGGSGSAITLSAGWSTLEGFKAVNASTIWSNYGIQVNANNNTIINNTVSNNFIGIYLFSSSGNNVSNNTANLNNRYGILLQSSSNNNMISSNNATNNSIGIAIYSYSSNNTLINNVMVGNDYNFDLGGSSDSDFDNNVETSNLVDGKSIYYLKTATDAVYDSSINAGTFYCINCVNVTIKDLNLNKNIKGLSFWKTTSSKIQNVSASKNVNGIDLRFSNNNTLDGNNVSDDVTGISLWYSSNNTLEGNNAPNNRFGIVLQQSSNNTLSDNNASNNNLAGIYILSYSSNNMLSRNNVSNNNDYGIYLWDSSNSNTIYNNYFNNMKNAFYNGINSWNITKTLSANIISGPYLGGNFWGKPDGTGFSQTCADGDADGICDSPYSLDSNNIDYLPLAYRIPAVTFNISGFKLNDEDNMGIPDWKIMLLNATTGLEIENTTTDSTGFYNFTGIANGTYNVTEEMKSGWTNVSPMSLILTINGMDMINENFTNIVITEAPVITSFNPPILIVSNNVGDTRTFNITVNQTVDVIWYLNGTAVSSDSDVTTSSYTNTSAAQGTWNVSAAASNTNGTDWEWIVTPPPLKNTISGYVINDINGNGKQDAGETGLPGWNIRLIGLGIGTAGINKGTVTDTHGFYIFEKLPAGSYMVTETMQGGYIMTGANVKVVALEEGKNAMVNFTNRPISSMFKIRLPFQ